MPAEGFKGHVATDGSLLGIAGNRGACGWTVVQLDCDEEMAPLHGMYGSMEAEYEVQRTIKRRSSGKYVDPSRSMWTTREQLVDYEKVRKSALSQELVMLIYGSKFGKDYMVW